MRVVIRGAGDLASGVALRLWRAGMDVVLLDVEKPTAIRRTVAFSEAIVHGKQTVEDVTARLAAAETAEETLAAGYIPVLVDPEGRSIPTLRPDALVDAIQDCFPAGAPAEAGSLLTNARQESAVRRSLEAVRRALSALDSGLTPDAVLTDAEDALEAIGELTGRTAKEEIVGAVFSRFCVGK